MKEASKKQILGATLVAAAFIFAGCTGSSTTTSTDSDSSSNTDTSSSSSSSTQETYTLDEIAQHSTKEDCWMAIDGKVYDATTYVSRHPGGDAILQGCGKEATEIFKSIGDHGSSTTDAQLERLVIGDLQQ